MSVTKDKNTGKWMSQIRIKDWTGKEIHKKKRGFSTKKEALQWERDFINQANGSLGMSFMDFIELYLKDMEKRLKPSTVANKRFLIDLKIIPYFGKFPLDAIKPTDIRRWQNELTNYRDENGKPYSQTYLKTINNQITAIFNYAVKYYGLKENPCHKAGGMGKKNADEMLFWTKDEFAAFISALKDQSVSYTMFMTLYYTGMREGDDDDKIRLNQRKPSKYKGLSRFGPEKNLQRINKFMKERPTFYKKLIQMKENFRFYLRCFYCITKVVILQFNSEKQDRISS